MKSISYGNFTRGMDRRHIDSKSADQGFYDLLNCYVDSQQRIRRRPGIANPSNFNGLTVGEFAYDGKIWALSANDNANPSDQPDAPHPEVWTVKINHGKNAEAVTYGGNIAGGVYLAVRFDDQTIQHYYTVLHEQVWKASADFSSWDPVGIKVLPTAAVDSVNKTLDSSFYAEITSLRPARTGTTEPDWGEAGSPAIGDKILDDVGQAPNASGVQWCRVAFTERTGNDQSFIFGPNGVYCYRQAEIGRKAYRATNIALNETKVAGIMTEFDTAADEAKFGDTIKDGQIIWEVQYAPKWVSNWAWSIGHPLTWDLIKPDARPDAVDWDAVAYVLPSAAGATPPYIYVGIRPSVKTATLEPNWSSTEGAFAYDGDVLWQTKTPIITDPLCPQTEQVIVLESKVWAIGSAVGSQVENDITRFSATNDPYDWSTEEDAGFLPTGVRATGSEIAEALGAYNKQLVVFMQDSIQLWDVDPDPATHALNQVIGEVGCRFYRTVVPFALDLFFLSDLGVRSVGQQKYVIASEDIDVGSPVDEPIRDAVDLIQEHPWFTPLAVFNPASGQFWVFPGGNTEAYVYTYSRQADIKAWSRYVLPVRPDYHTAINGRLYMRAGDRLLHADENANVDYDGAFEIRVDFSFQSLREIGIMKQFLGVDVRSLGEAQLSHKFDAQYPTRVTPEITVTGNTRSGTLLPVEVVATEIAPVVDVSNSNDWQLDAITYYYESLGNI